MTRHYSKQWQAANLVEYLIARVWGLISRLHTHRSPPHHLRTRIYLTILLYHRMGTVQHNLSSISFHRACQAPMHILAPEQRRTQPGWSPETKSKPISLDMRRPCASTRGVPTIPSDERPGSRRARSNGPSTQNSHLREALLQPCHSL